MIKNSVGVVSGGVLVGGSWWEVFRLKVCGGRSLGWRSVVGGVEVGGLWWEVLRLEVCGGRSLGWRSVVGGLHLSVETKMEI